MNEQVFFHGAFCQKALKIIQEEFFKFLFNGNFFFCLDIYVN